MRTHVISPDLQGRIDGAVQTMLLSGFADQSSAPHDCDVILVPVTTLQDFRFNPQLNDIGKPYVILDYSELEWNYFDVGNPTLLFGQNAKECRWLNPHWHALDDFVREHPPAMYFKRELLAKDVTPKVKPIDWPCVLTIPPFESEDDFNRRPIEVFFNWGFSHPSRPQLHADIFRGMTTHGIGVISETDQFEGYFKAPCSRTWVSVFSPHYSRKPIADMVWYQARSKLSVSLPGAGVKCFRHSEAPVGTIMALPLDDMAWSYDWNEEQNCKRLRTGHEFEDLEAATKHDNLYEVYLRGQETIARYQTKPYVRDYVIPMTEGALNE